MYMKHFIFIYKVLSILNGNLFKVSKQQLEREKTHKRWNLFALFLSFEEKKAHPKYADLYKNKHTFFFHLIYWFLYEFLHLYYENWRKHIIDVLPKILMAPQKPPYFIGFSVIFSVAIRRINESIIANLFFLS